MSIPEQYISGAGISVNPGYESQWQGERFILLTLVLVDLRVSIDATILDHTFTVFRHFGRLDDGRPTVNRWVIFWTSVQMGVMLTEN